jgi:hypothetical protein
MNEKLRLGPLPKTETVKLTISLPLTVKADLDRYAELFGAAHGEVVDAASLAPHMLAAFIDRDRAFRRARQARAATPSSAAMASSTSSTGATSAEE